MSLIRYTGGDLLSSLQTELNSLINRDFDSEIKWTPNVDVQTTDDKYIVTADLPGVDPKDINVNIEGNVLTIDGERRSERSNESSGFTRTERFTGRFFRQFTLPEAISADDISAKTDKGVLRLMIPKMQKKAVKKIEVK